MRDIFTYPNNAGTSYIDPLYVGDDTVGFQKRIKDLKDGNYKAWDGTAPTDTVSELMSNISKFSELYYDNTSTGYPWNVGDVNITINDMYTYPLLTGSVTTTQHDDITATVTASDIDGYFVSSNHGLTQGDLITASLFNGDYTVLNGNNYYVQLNGINQFRLSVDAGLTQIVSLYDLKDATVASSDSLSPSTITTTATHSMTDGMPVIVSGLDGDWAEYNGQTLYVDSISSNTLQLATDAALLNKIGFPENYTAQSIQSFDIMSTPMTFVPNPSNDIPEDGSVITFNSFGGATSPKEIIDAINAYATTLYSKVNGGVIELYTDLSLTTPFIFTQAMRNYTQTVDMLVHTKAGFDSMGNPYDYGDNMGIEVYNTSIINGSRMTVNEVDSSQTDTLYGVMAPDTVYYYSDGRVYTDISTTTEVSNFRADIAKCEILKNPDARGWFSRDYLDDSGLIVLNDGSGNVTLRTIDDNVVADGNAASRTFYTKNWNFIQTKNTYRDWAYASANNLVYDLPLETANTNTQTLFTDAGFTVDNGTRVFKLSDDNESPNTWFAYTTLMKSDPGAAFQFPNENYTPYNAIAGGAFKGPFSSSYRATTSFTLDATYVTRDFYDYKGPGTGVGAAFNASLYTNQGPAILNADGQQPRIVEVYAGNESKFVVMIPTAPANNSTECAVFCYDIDANGVVGNMLTSVTVAGSSEVDISTHDQGVRLTDHNVAVPVNMEVVGIPSKSGFPAFNQFFIPDFAPSNDLRMGDIVSLFGTDWVVFPTGPTTSGGYPGIAYSVFPYTDASTALAFNYNDDIFGSNIETTLTTSYNSWITLSDSLASNYAMLDYTDIPYNNLQKALEVKMVPIRVTGDYDTNYTVVPATTGNILEIDTTPAWVYASVNPVVATTGQAFFDNPDTYSLTSIDLTIPGNAQYQYLTSTGLEPGAEINPTVYRSTNGGQKFTYYPSAPDITLTTDANGRLTGATLNSPLLGFDEPKDIAMDIFSLPDTYTPPALSPAAQEDIFDTADEWTTSGYNAAKEFGKDIIPTTAEITYNTPSTTNMSQNGKKYVRSAGFTRWKLNVSYTNLTKAEFQILQGDAQAARGQATPFFLVTSQWGNKVLDFENITSTTAPKLIEPYTAGETIMKVGGYKSNESEVFKKGQIIRANSDNGGVSTVLNTVDANVYGEAEVRIAFALGQNSSIGNIIYTDNYHYVVTLDSDEFTYSVDTYGLFNVNVGFELGEWG